MSTGAGIVWATVLILIFLGLKFISKNGKWRLIGRVVGGLVAAGVVLGLGTYLYLGYEKRPTPQNSLFGIELGMKPVDVRLALGEPKIEDENKNAEGEDTLFYVYETYSWEGPDKYVRFKKPFGEWKVYAICDLDPAGEPLGIYTFTQEKEVFEKFGEPTNQSINKDGLRKFVTFGRLNIAVEIEKKQVTAACVTDSDAIFYLEEYGALGSQ